MAEVGSENYAIDVKIKNNENSHEIYEGKNSRLYVFIGDPLFNIIDFIKTPKPQNPKYMKYI